MKPLETPGVLEVFTEYHPDPELDLSKNEVYLKMKATPRSGDVGKAFLQVPTCVPASPDTATAYVVHEVRSSHAGTNRRVLGVFRSREDAEQKAAEARASINSFLRRYNAWEFGKETNGGTILTYYHLGNPLAIVGYAVYIEETPMTPCNLPNVSRQETTSAK